MPVSCEFHEARLYIISAKPIVGSVLPKEGNEKQVYRLVTFLFSPDHSDNTDGRRTMYGCFVSIHTPCSVTGHCVHVLLDRQRSVVAKI